MEKETKAKNPHEGHRERLLKTALEGDFNSLSNVQQVEVLLFFVLPRVDVNPIAHRLIQRFGSFATIIDASIDDLASVKGLGLSSAGKVKVFRKLFETYNSSKVDNKFYVSTYTELLDSIKELMKFAEVEETYAFSFDKLNRCNGYRKIAFGDKTNVKFNVRELYRFMDTYDSDYIILVHNHPEGKSHPSATDRESYADMLDRVDALGSVLKDMFIVGIDGVFSMESQSVRPSGVSYKENTISKMPKIGQLN